MIGAIRLLVCIFLACWLALAAGRTHADELLVGNKSADSVWRLSARDGL